MNIDIELVEKIIKGEIDAFEELIEKYEKMVYNLAYRIFNNYSDAEDMTQEVFLKVYKNIQKCSGKECIKTWVYTIAYNTCIDEIRKRKGKANISLNSTIDSDEGEYQIEIPSKEATPEKQLINKEEIKEIENAINKLSEVHKTLFFLRDIKGLTYNEISEVMGINIGTVKSKLNRARTNLKNILKK